MGKKTCARIAACKTESSERHNQRLKNLDYVNDSLTKNNSQEILESIASRLQTIEEIYKEVTGQKMQKTAEPILECVLVIDDATTMDQIKEFAASCQKEIGLTPFQIYIHKDEGHYDDDNNWIPNLHAHIIFDATYQSHILVERPKKSNGKNIIGEDGKPVKIKVDGYGKTIKLTRSQMSRMQDLAAMATGLERGTPSGKVGLGAIDYKIKQKESDLTKIQASIDESITASNTIVEDLVDLVERSGKITKDTVDKTEKAYADLLQAEKRVKGLTTMIRNLEVRKTEIEQEIDKAKAEGNKSLTNLQTHLNQINNTIKDKEKKLAEAEEKLMQIQSKIDEEQKLLNDKIKEMETTQSRIKLLSNKVGELTTEQMRLTNLIESLRDQLKSTRSKDDKLSFEIIRKREELEECERNLYKVETSLAAKTRELETAKEEQTKLDAMIKDKETTIESLDTRMENLVEALISGESARLGIVNLLKDICSDLIPILDDYQRKLILGIGDGLGPIAAYNKGEDITPKLVKVIDKYTADFRNEAIDNLAGQGIFSAVLATGAGGGGADRSDLRWDGKTADDLDEVERRRFKR